jgi:3-deoxy-manno-octulosonate cytidylyltransferase (CMP-KDO synthetase)
VEHTAQNPSLKVIAIIPARLASTRLEGKLLLSVAGKPLILHTLERAKSAKNVSRVIVATDDEQILRVVEESGNEAVLTSKDHQSGSDRIAEVAENLEENSIIVNVQGDEPLIPASTIEKAVAEMLNDETADIVTTCEPIHEIQDVLSSDVVKVVTDENGYALYFSRSPIPFPREAVKKFGSFEAALKQEKDLLATYRKHTGLYVYRREFLLKYTKQKQTALEKLEMLEQLRALENGAKIKVVEVLESSIGVDTPEDFERVRRILEKQKITYRRASKEDVPAVAKAHVESWQKSFPGIAPQEFLDEMSVETREQAFKQAFEKPGYKMFVAEDSERGIVGFADFGAPDVKNSRYEAALYAIYLLQEYQRQGIGENLFRLCQKEMISDGFNSMYLDALEASPYRSFYEKMGGHVKGQGNHFLGDIEYQTVIYGWDNLRESLKI